jgi:hypothetical protein
MSKLRHSADFVVDRQRFETLSDRRRLARYPSDGNECWLGWWQAGTWRIMTAALRDISQGGAGLSLRLAPPQRSAIWFCPKESGHNAWVEGTVVRVSRPGFIRFVLGCPTDVGLHFREECPWETLRAALFGLGVTREEETVAPPPLPRSGGPSS